MPKNGHLFVLGVMVLVCLTGCAAQTGCKPSEAPQTAREGYKEPIHDIRQAQHETIGIMRDLREMLFIIRNMRGAYI